MSTPVPATDMPDHVVPADDMPDDPHDTPETASRLAGLFSRASAKGVADTADQLINLQNPFQSAWQFAHKLTHTGAQPQEASPDVKRTPQWDDIGHPERWSDDVDSLMDRAGAPKPETRGERIGSAAIENLPSGLVAPEYRLMGALSNMGSGAASQIAHEDEDGPLAELAASLVGAGIGAGAGSLANRAARKAVTLLPKTPPPTPKPITPEEAVAQNLESQNMGAAAVPPDLTGVHPVVKKAIGDIATRMGGYLHPAALERTIDAGKLLLPEGSAPFLLRRGQALDWPLQRTREKNFRPDTDMPELGQSMTDQPNLLRDSLGEIRRVATPTIVQKTNYMHDQTAIREIKAYDNAISRQKRAAYQDLADQNGGYVPIDPKQTHEEIFKRLDLDGLDLLAEQDPILSKIQRTLIKGQPIQFKQFESWRTTLARLQRGRDSLGAAAGIFRNELENMHLPPEASHLKALADKARGIAKYQFDLKEQNPAYKAAVEDNVPRIESPPGEDHPDAGLHDLSQPSPLAGHFLDAFTSGNEAEASPVYVQRLKAAVPSQELSDAIQAHALNDLSRAAGIIPETGDGQFTYARFRNAFDNIGEDKARTLFSPDTIEELQRLKRVANVAYKTSPADFDNKSNSALALADYGAIFPKDPKLVNQLLAHVADYGTDVLAHALSPKIGPTGHMMKNSLKRTLARDTEAKRLQSVKDAKIKFAREATEPGSGLDVPVDVPVRKERAAGGRVDEDALVGRLTNRWKAAKRDTDETTKPLLNVPDAAIIRALDIAQEHL